MQKLSEMQISVNFIKASTSNDMILNLHIKLKIKPDESYVKEP